MSLSSNQAEQIQKALLDTFDEADLRQLVRYELDASLDVIAGGTDLEERTFNLVQWADQHGSVLKLVEGALDRNPDNPALQALAEEAKTWHLEPPEEGKEPYQGLRFFDVGDRDRFFGREQLTAELVDYLRTNRLLTVIGASGSGKSSVVRAGVVPTLREDDRRLIAPIVTPTAHPLETLATALVPRGCRLTAVTDLMDDMRRDARCRNSSPGPTLPPRLRRCSRSYRTNVWSRRCGRSRRALTGKLTGQNRSSMWMSPTRL